MITLTVRQLSKKYGTQTVLRNLSFTTSAGVLGIAGRNGSGKSTLLLCLTGLVTPTAGSVVWSRNGNEWDREKLNRELGFAAPYLELYEGLNCRENMKFLLDLNRNPDEVADVDEFLKTFGAERFLEKQYGDLSTGQRQRIKLAASVIQQPSILCLDEPGTNLDKQGKQRVRELIDECRRKGTMVLIASNQEDELSLCDEVINLDERMTPD